MPTATELIHDIRPAHAAYMTLMGRISPAAANAPGLVGTWSARECLAHILGWQVLALEVIEGLRDGRAVADPEDENLFNAQAVASRADQSWEAICAEMDATVTRLIALVESLPEAQREEKLVRGWLRGSTLGHYSEHQPAFEHAAGT
jgi:hypothetical protein